MTFINTGYKKCGLIIGINYKGDKEAKLNGCINDAKRSREFITKRCNFPNECIEFLTEDEKIIPTKQNIIDSIKRLVKRVKDTGAKEVWFSYSGHGTFIKSKSKGESDNQDEVLVPLDYKTKGFISDNLLYDILVKPLPKDCNLFVVVDACHSGTSLDLPYQYRSDQGFIVEKSLDNLANVIKLSGCRDDQTSADAHINGRYQGALTAAILKSMEVLKYNFTAKEIITQCELYMTANEYTQIPILSLSRKELINKTILGFKKKSNINIQLEGDRYCKEESSWNLLCINTNKVLFPKDKQFYSKNEKMTIDLNLKKGGYILFIKDKYGDGGVRGTINRIGSQESLKTVQFNDKSYKAIDFEVL
jgi:hypothetical protein